MSDELVPLCIYAVLRYRDRLGLSSFRSSVLILMLLISVLISFSRYFWGVHCACLCAWAGGGQEGSLYAGACVDSGRIHFAESAIPH